jgi:hypothetical protein
MLARNKMEKKNSTQFSRQFADFRSKRHMSETFEIRPYDVKITRVQLLSNRRLLLAGGLELH